MNLPAQTAAPAGARRRGGAAAPQASGTLSVEAQLLQALLRPSDEDDIGHAMADMALQLQRHSGWRWAVIARLVDDGQSAQMLALVDRGRRVVGNTYEMALTPCATLAHSGEVSHIDAVTQRYPSNELLQGLGVLHYAGLVCRRAGQVLGHVFLMHDGPMPQAQWRRADPLLQLVAMRVGERLELAALRVSLRELQRQADTDALTQLPNRHAFERELALQRSLVTEGARQDSLLAILDVNGLKAVNDSLGHLAGDALLRRVADGLRGQLRRCQDQVFRIGGDEFALLVDGPKDGSDRWLVERSEALAESIRAAGFPQAGLSVGTAGLREAGGSRTEWLAMADARMYAHKGSQRRD